MERINPDGTKTPLTMPNHPRIKASTHRTICTHAGIASQMFRTLAEEGINIQMISTSEIKISVVIDEKYMELAVRALHKAFALDQPA